MRMKTNMPQLKRAKINGRKYPWPHNPMVQPMKPIAAPLWKRAPAKPAAAFWGDPDGDGVINAFDCAPRNPRRQGPQHKTMGESEEYKKLPKCKYCGYYLCQNFNKPECKEMHERIEKRLAESEDID